MPELRLIFIAAIVLGVIVGSLATWSGVFARWRRGLPALEYEPRRPVPWGPAAPFAAFLLLAFFQTQAAALVGLPGREIADDRRLVLAMMALMAANLSAMILALLFVRYAMKADRGDLGLPASPSVLGKDIGLGALGFLAASVPVYTLQGVLVRFLREYEHPLIDVLQERPEMLLWGLAFLAAVIVAPIVEEFIFRLLLQGWLEKVEDNWLARKARAAAFRPPGAPAGPQGSTPPEGPPQEAAAGDVPDRAGGSTPEDQTLWHPFAPPGEAGPPIQPAEQGPPSDQPLVLPATSLLGLPRGALPIVISSLIFAMAHWGQGPAPVSLFFLSLVMGYIYRQTHRIMPAVVMHMLFNAFSLSLLRLVPEVGG